MSTVTAIRQQKISKVEEITSLVNDSALIILSDYSGLSANEMNALRSQLRENGATSKVYKNTFMRRALESLGIEIPAKFLKGPTIFVSAKEDVVAASKVLAHFAKKNEALTIKGGVMQSAAIDNDTINALAKLPSRDELIAKVVGLIKAPLTALVGSLSGPIRGITGVLSSIKIKKQNGGE
jgi:large subunit ribosomal protein L10